jgi:Tfp pilus assembly protein PilP
MMFQKLMSGLHDNNLINFLGCMCVTGCFVASSSMLVACGDSKKSSNEGRIFTAEDAGLDGNAPPVVKGSIGIEDLGDLKNYVRAVRPDIRDPFHSYFDDIFAPIQSHDDRDLSKIVFRENEIGDLRIVAIITDTYAPQAMLTNPIGVGRVVNVNSRVGRSDARITDIVGNEIIFELKNQDGTMRTEVKTMRAHAELIQNELLEAQ